MKQKQYLPKTAKIRFIIYWRKENSEQEIRIILPELYFEKRDAAFLETPNVVVEDLKKELV